MFLALVVLVLPPPRKGGYRGTSNPPANAVSSTYAPGQLWSLEQKHWKEEALLSRVVVAPQVGLQKAKEPVTQAGQHQEQQMDLAPANTKYNPTDWP